MKSVIRIFGSGSNGNCLAIYDGKGKCLVVDVGLSYKDVLKRLNFQLDACVGIVASHAHFADHTRSLSNFINLGMPCYGNKDVCDNHVGCNELPRVLRLGGFKIQHFDLVHNVPNTAFIIDTFDGIRILYCTDTKYIPKIVRGVHYAIIECNHDDEDMIDNAMNDEFSMSHHENHQSLDNCVDYLKKIYSKDLQGVILWHLSSTNINAEKALERVKKELCFDSVYVGKSGLDVELMKEEF